MADLSDSTYLPLKEAAVEEVVEAVSIEAVEAAEADLIEGEEAGLTEAVEAGLTVAVEAEGEIEEEEGGGEVEAAEGDNLETTLPRQPTKATSSPSRAKSKLCESINWKIFKYFCPYLFFLSFFS